MMSVNLGDIAILNIKGSDYRCMISLISKNEAIIKRWLDWKKWNVIKMGKEMLTFGNIEIERPLFFERCRYWKSISI